MIGILTFHRASNFGAVLQAYALNAYIGENGGSSEIINYYCKSVEEAHNPGLTIGKVGLVRGIKILHNKIRKYRSFEEFRNRSFSFKDRVDHNSIGTVSGRYTSFIAGSDQVWSPEFAGGDDTYLLSFTDCPRKYSYAASFGTVTDDEVGSYADKLSGFSTVSVREKTICERLQKAGIFARTDVDPTFLLNGKRWGELAAPIKEDNYILIYTVQPPVKLLDYARELSAKSGCKIVYLNNEHRANKDIPHVRFASPEEFLGWIRNASYVLTNSFHGTAFSLIFNKNFKVELETKKKRNTRSEDLVKSLGLDKSILCGSGADFEFDYDWESVHAGLDTMIDSSGRYISKIIEEDNRA